MEYFISNMPTDIRQEFLITDLAVCWSDRWQAAVHLNVASVDAGGWRVGMMKVGDDR